MIDIKTYQVYINLFLLTIFGPDYTYHGNSRSSDQGLHTSRFFFPLPVRFTPCLFVARRLRIHPSESLSRSTSVSVYSSVSVLLSMPASRYDCDASLPVPVQECQHTPVPRSVHRFQYHFTHRHQLSLSVPVSV